MKALFISLLWASLLSNISYPQHDTYPTFATYVDGSYSYFKHQRWYSLKDASFQHSFARVPPVPRDIPWCPLLKKIPSSLETLSFVQKRHTMEGRGKVAFPCLLGDHIYHILDCLHIPFSLLAWSAAPHRFKYFQVGGADRVKIHLFSRRFLSHSKVPVEIVLIILTKRWPLEELSIEEVLSTYL